ncbi:unnamed protein product [Clonostachys rosea f. rosea IK726]|uniref:Zn(2)-C6 fungal-type domain-containing protein n=2 Tax=Bionectria ochroleuca TaxID=29856 RepID=A0A0B7KJ02_BIOOC|nr:unnamed protein product [Clonostachys rosea f. rosea IK726]
MSQQSRRPRRLLAACHRCHSQKIKCSGKQPCQSCSACGKASECKFPSKERKIPISESYLRKLEADSKRLQSLTQNPTPQSFGQDTPSIDRDDDPIDSTNISSDESNMLNPLFDGQPENVVNERCSESGYIGEASCTAFSNRLLQCLDPDYTPSTAGFSNYCRINTSSSLASLQEHDISGFPERMHARLLLNVARRFIGNYHPLFLKVTFMKELDAMYRQEFSPSTMWLCKFYTLMCLGEIYTNRRGIDNSNRVPGTEYYAKAVGMLQDFYEEPSLMQVEVLTLLAWASNILGRVRTAYCYSGTAMRLAMGIGMHRPASRGTTLTSVERESRRRTWWVLYFFDRFSASKLGQPVSIRDEDIDVEMPSMDGLSEEEKMEFLDPQSLVTNIKLARIIGNILTDIYGIPNRTQGLRIHRVHGILKQLREWHDDLPPDMRVKERGTPRPVSSLHLAYNQCIIQSTRPVLLHLFKTQFQLSSKTPEPHAAPRRQVFSSITLALAESCINAAQASSRIAESLFLDGSIAIFGYWDAHHIFSAALILIMSALMKPTEENSDALEMLLSILRSMRNDGNIPAVQFCETLSYIQSKVIKLRSMDQAEQQQVFLDTSTTVAPPDAGAPVGKSDDRQERGISASGDDSALSMALDGEARRAEPSMTYRNMDDILGNPLIGSFLDENGGPWPDLMFSGDGTLKELASEIEEQFLFQM